MRQCSGEALRLNSITSASDEEKIGLGEGRSTTASHYAAENTLQPRRNVSGATRSDDGLTWNRVRKKIRLLEGGVLKGYTFILPRGKRQRERERERERERCRRSYEVYSKLR